MNPNTKGLNQKDTKEVSSYRNLESYASARPRKPGPRPVPCRWCNKVNCNHCQCAGYGKCDHKQGEQCSRQRYKRRLVCNPCEKHKLRTELANGPSSGSNGAAIGTIPSSNSLNLLSVASTATPTTKDTTEKETIDTTGIEVNNEKKTSSINTNQSFNALLHTVSLEYKKEVIKRSLSSLDASSMSPSMFTSNSVVFHPSTDPSASSQKLYKGFKRSAEPLDDDLDVGLDLDNNNNGESSVSHSTVHPSATEPKLSIKPDSLPQSKSPIPYSPAAIHDEPVYSRTPLWKYKVNNPFSSSHLSPIPSFPDEPVKTPLTITTNMFVEASTFGMDRKEFIQLNNRFIMRLNEKSLSRHASTDTDHQDRKSVV